MSRRKALWVFMIVSMLLFVSNVHVFAETEETTEETTGEAAEVEQSHWQEETEGWRYYYADGTYPVSTKVTIEDKDYYFNDKGYRQNGWILINDSFYFFDSKAEDAMQKEAWIETSGKSYYVNKLGKMLVNQWILSDETWYFVNKKGARIENQWVLYKQKWYFLKEDGVMASDEVILWKNETYYLNKSGHMASNTWVLTGDSWYYLNKSGHARKNQWVKAASGWYYLNKDGTMAKEQWIRGQNTWYFVKKSGLMVENDWVKSNNQWYYLKKDGRMMASEWLRYKNKYYFMNSKGIMVSNSWVAWRGKWYFQNADGIMVTNNWLKWKNIWFYLKSDGVMAKSEKLTISKVVYYFDGNGHWIEHKKQIIAIDAGHQAQQNTGKEPLGPGSSTMKQKVASGTQGVATGINEYVLNLQVALKLQKILEERGYEVYMVRTTHDVDISNAQRAQKAANAGANILVRIHANGVDNSSVSGALTMAPNSDNPFLSKYLISESQTLSKKMIDHICKATGAKNLGVQYYNNMTGINWSTIPVTIVEMGFMSNPAEDRLLNTDSYQNKMATGIANGVDAYFK